MKNCVASIGHWSENNEANMEKNVKIRPRKGKIKRKNEENYSSIGN